MAGEREKAMGEGRTSVDLRQVRTLVRAGLRQMVRGSLTPFTGGAERGPSRWAFPLLLGMNVLYSLILSAVVVKSVNLFSGLIVGGSLMMMLVAMQILMEFGQVIVTPDEYAVIGAMPVSSRTYYAAKLAHLLTLVTILTAAGAIVPAVMATIFRHSIAAFFIVLIHFWAVCVTISMAAAGMYAWLMSRFNRSRMERVLGYFQFGFGLIIWLGIFMLPDVMRRWLTAPGLADHAAWRLSPSYWFAAWVRLVDAGWNWTLFGWGMFGVAALASLLWLVSGRLSLSYAESLSSGTATVKVLQPQNGQSALGRLWRRLTTPEDRAVFALAKAQFRHDVRFRMTVLGSTAMVFILPIIMFTQKESFPHDPFLGPSHGTGIFNSMLAYLLCATAMNMQASIQMSREWKAGWIYYVTPADHRRLIRAGNRIVMICLVLPVGMAVWILLSFVFGAVFNALLHALYLCLLGVLSLALLGIAKRGLPFAAEYKSGGFAGGIFGMFLLSAVLVVVPVALITGFGYGGYGGWALWMIGTGIVYWLLTVARDRRIERAAMRGEFAG
ncbi:MAG: hypothetical protein PHR28_00950 [candidate division Zixibacteria bacterium]|nr:hypothetical protein [candidate division Zixibacteria bacterium]